jgi:hypothetical protein
MLRDVVIHLLNEQPILADLIAEPTAVDTCLICTNLRTTNGKTPVFVEDGASTFVFPMAHIRFIEVRRVAVEEGEFPALPESVPEQPKAGKNGKGAGSPRESVPEDEAVSAYAVSPLQRLAWVGGDSDAPPEGAPAASTEAVDEPEADANELLRRVRDA